MATGGLPCCRDRTIVTSNDAWRDAFFCLTLFDSRGLGIFARSEKTLTTNLLEGSL